MADIDLAALLVPALEGLPGVDVQRKANHVSFLTGKKVFAYTMAAGLVVKLPAERIAELVDKGKAAPLVMGKRTMKEWAVIEPKEAKKHAKNPALLKEAMGFVGG